MTNLDSSKTVEKHDVFNPYDQTYLGSVPLIKWAEIDSYLTNAEQLFKDRQQWLPAYERMNILKKLATLISQRADELALLIASEGGKPLVDAKVEVARAIDGVESVSYTHLTLPTSDLV